MSSSEHYFTKAKQSLALMQYCCNNLQSVKAYRHAYRTLLSAANALLVKDDFVPSTITLTLLTFFKRCREQNLVSRDCLRTYSEVISMRRSILKNADLIDVEAELSFLASSVASALAEVALALH